MGLFQKGDGGIMDVIRCDESEYLVWKWRPQGAPGKTSSRANAIRWGSSLRVKDGSAAIFVYPQENGIMQDFIEGPYDGVIETKNFPVLSNILGLAYGGDSPFQAEIYFINLANLIQIQFGVPYFDIFDPRFLDLGVPTAVRGSLNFHIADCQSFIKLHRLEEFDLTTFQAQIKDEIINCVKDVVSNAPIENEIPVIQIERRISDIRTLIEAKLNESLGEHHAVVVSRVTIAAIEIDKNSKGYKKLESLTQNKATMLVQGAANLFTTMSAQKSGAKGVKNAMKSEDASKDSGKKVAGAIGGVFGKKAKVTPPPIPTSGFYVAVEGKQKGPFDMSRLKKMMSEDKFSEDSLAWKEGMENWMRAGDIEELSTLFNFTPPIPSE